MELLKEGPIEVDITFTNGDLQKNLYAENIYLDKNETRPCFVVEMEKEVIKTYTLDKYVSIHNIVIKKSRLMYFLKSNFGDYFNERFSLKIVLPGKVVNFTSVEMYLSDQVDYFIVLSNLISI